MSKCVNDEMNDSMAATETSVGLSKFRLEAVELHRVSTVYTREVCVYMFVFKMTRAGSSVKQSKAQFVWK